MNITYSRYNSKQNFPESAFRLIHEVLDPFMAFWRILKKDWVPLVGLSFLDAHLCQVLPYFEIYQVGGSTQVRTNQQGC